MESGRISVFTTSRSKGEHIAEREPLQFQEDMQGVESPAVNIHDDIRYQEFLGFGGAFTEAAADTYLKLPQDVQMQFMDAYFMPGTGLGYSFCRTHMNSCDFSLGNYEDAAEPGDTKLASFNIGREKAALLPMIKDAQKRGPITLFVSPWSPPAWMKDNGEMNHGGKLLPQYAHAWAEHFALFIEALASKGVPVWGVTVQNEPKATQTWDSCVYTAEEEADFVAEHLWPVLERHGLSHIKIMIWDHNKERVCERAEASLRNAKAAAHIWGIAFHWYSGDHFEELEMAHKRWPDKALVFTEGCAELSKSFENWPAAEAYAHDIIGNLNNYTAAWCEWNLLLDHKGGPNHVGNYCLAPVMASEDFKSVSYEPSFWYIGQFSRFILPGSVRIGCSRFTDRLECTAFLRPDGTKVLVVLNRTDADIPFVLRWNGKIARAESREHSIMTLVF